MTQGSERDYIAENSGIRLSVVQLPQDWLLERPTYLSSSSPCLSHPPMPCKVMQARLGRLMVATQQVRGKIWYESLNKDGWQGGFNSQQAMVILYQKLLDITLQSPLRRVNLMNKTNHAWLYQPNPGSTNHVRVHAAHDCEHGCYNSFTLYRGCTCSPWVAIILGSRIPVVQANTLTHFRGVR
jgi:hypothetical protein